MEGEPERKRARTERTAPVLVFAHGAGAPSSSEWMIRWSELLRKATGAVEVITFDYPYLAGGKKGAPPKAEKLVEFHAEQVNGAMSKHPGHPVVLVGKSMGSRVSCMVAAKPGLQVAAVVCLGYPLKGTSGALRDETLLQLGVPIMFVQGSKDTLCPLDNLKEVVGRMSVKTMLHVVEAGDHSFKVAKGVLKKKGSSQDEVEQHAVDAVRLFLASVLEEAEQAVNS